MEYLNSGDAFLFVIYALAFLTAIIYARGQSKDLRRDKIRKERQALHDERQRRRNRRDRAKKLLQRLS